MSRWDKHLLRHDSKGDECPQCGYTGAVSVSPEKGLWFCHSCHLGGRTDDEDHPTVSDATTKRTYSREEKRAYVAQILSECGPVAGSAAEIYLNERGLGKYVSSPFLWAHEALWNAESKREWDALVAVVIDPMTSNRTAIHRTWLTPGGCKAPLKHPRKTLGSAKGGLIALDNPPVTIDTDRPGVPVHELHVVIGEGIESSASAGILFELPAFAAVSAGNLGFHLRLPPEITSVVIAADMDAPGRLNMGRAVHRWQAEGRHVEITYPRREGADFNDLLRERVQDG